MQQSGFIFKYPKLVLFLVVFVLYGNTIKNGYSLDDNCVTGPECITSTGIKSIPRIFTSFYTYKSEKNKFEYRPMVAVSFAVEHQFFGVKPSVSHFFNIVIYFLLLLVLWQFLKLVFRKYPPAFSFLITLLFAVMPIHTEVVASIKNRDILLCFLFVILGATYFLKTVISNKHVILKIAISVLCFYFAFLCKTDALPFLAIVPVIAFIEFKVNVKWILISVVTFIIGFLLFKITRKIGLDSEHNVRTLLYYENPLFFERGFSSRVISLFNCLGFYCMQCGLPLKQSSYYGYDTIPVHEFSFFYGTLGVILFSLILYGLIWSYRQKENAILIGLFIFTACISMYLNFVLPAVGIVADRFCFAASLGGAIFTLAAYQKWANSKLVFSSPTKGFASIALVFFSILIIQRNSEWKDLTTLINADVKKYPESVFLNYKAGANIIKSMEARNNSQLKAENQKQVADARLYFEKTIAKYPDFPEVLNYLSYVMIFLYNDFANALPHINKSLSIEYSTEVEYYKGICYRELKKQDSSEIILLNCVKHDVNYQNAYDLLVYDYNIKKQYSKSVALLQNAIDKGNKSDKIVKMLAQAKLLAQDTISTNK